MSFVYTVAKDRLLKGLIDFSDSSADYRVILVMIGTTLDSEEDILTLSQGTIAEYDGTGYSTGGVPLVGNTVTFDSGSDESEWDANDTVWAALTDSSGAGDAVGAVIIDWEGSLANSIPIAYIDDGFPVSGNGGSVTIQWSADGILNCI